MPTKKFCVMTIGRTGSTSLMHALEKFDDIALPSRDTDCVDSELLHPDRIKQYMQHYQPHAEVPIEKPAQLINAFYDSHADMAYAGFKSMPNRHSNYIEFIKQSDIRFITLVRNDLASTVASFLIAMETGSWRRFGGEHPGKWRFLADNHASAALGNLKYVIGAHLMLSNVPNAIRLDYESLCDPDFKNQELDDFFGRKIGLTDPKPPTSGAEYVENWDEFKEFIDNATQNTLKNTNARNESARPLKFEGQKQLVFVCGLPRSGTSVLFKCLRDHSEISGFENTGAPEDEGQYLQSVYPKGLDHGGPGRFGFDPNAFLDETSPLVTESNASKLISEWGKYWDISRPVLLEKSPPNVIRTRFLQALFPNTQFIMVLRHPLAVSFATQKWSRTSIASLLEHWLICWERFDLDRKYLSNVTIIKYEDFVNRPDSVMGNLMLKLGLDSEPLKQEIKADINKKYFEQWAEFRGGFSENPSERVYYDHILESRVARFGYSLKNPELIKDYP